MYISVCAVLVLVALLEAAVGSIVVVNKAADVAKALKSKNIIISNLNVPGGETLKLDLLPGTKLLFNGTIRFGYKPWNGTLVKIKGSNVTIVGAPGSALDGNGKRWWDGKGARAGKLKPRFMELKLNHSIISGLKIKDMPAFGVAIKDCNNLTLTSMMIDNKSGAKNSALDTDGFMVSKSTNVVIKNSVIYSQGHCLALSSGNGIIVEHAACVGGEGFTLGTVGVHGHKELKKVSIRNCKIMYTDYGIRIKLASGGKGKVHDVQLQNIILDEIRKVGIAIHEGNDTKNQPTGTVPVTKLRVKDVRGTVITSGMNIKVLVKNASEWSWDSDITGGTVKNSCKGVEKGSDTLCM